MSSDERSKAGEQKPEEQATGIKKIETHRPRTNAAANGGTTTPTQIKGVAGQEDPLDIRRPRHG